ncbi:hypothetical protein HHK36_015571 [Tetracentron sinense]|uniref:Glucan endo-1,3-beta-D-glucosidase n=1 Tax=Tetracentron sinense TaxID=13715 RepID=A0A834Z6F6_TETSI|nr:hypothetical protein HHK36_015571 [Tetracentron sinense]
MKIQHLFFSFFPILLLSFTTTTAATSIGVCYGRVADNLPPPSNVINLLKSNGITKIRLFNTDPDVLKAFSGTGIKLIIGVPNEILPVLANGAVNASTKWLQANIFAHVPANQILYIAVGNEIFLKDPYYTPFVLPAIMNLYQALQTLDPAGKIKLSTPHAASILSNSYPPSAAAFDPYLQSAMIPLLQFLHDSRAPFMVNAYPFFSYSNNPKDISLNYTLFNSAPMVQDGGLTYSNLFDATIDAFVSAMENEGFAGIPVVVTETGWPTAGGGAALPENALNYNGNIIKRALNDVGTPKRPGVGVEVFLFALFDENQKSGEEFERHFGIFGPNGVKTYDLKFK